MEIKPGAHVRFLNFTGEGTVRRLLPKNIVVVEDENGFETPVLASEVVVVEATDEFNFTRTQPAPKAADEAKPKQTPKPASRESYELTPDYETPEGEQLSLFLAFVPSDIRHLSESSFDLYVVNDSNYFVSFVIAEAGELLRVRWNDTIEPQTKLLLGTVSYEDLNDLQNLRVQAFAYKNTLYNFKPAVDSPLSLRLTRFFKMHSFVENDFFDSPALLEPVVRNDFSVADALRTPTAQEKPKPVRQQISKPNQHPELLEVDLHITALMDNTNGLSPKDMLDYQLEKFNEVMKANLKRKGTKIVFIHGKGEGKLRAEIIRNLKLFYPVCTYQDANFQKYGFGATMVTIH